MPLYVRESILPAPAGKVYDWHLRDGAFERLTPAWEKARVLSAQEIRDGNQMVLETALGPLKLRWTARYQDCVPGARFTDEQVEGPFALWVHRHDFLRVSDTESRMRDHVEYEAPLGMNGGWADDVIHERLERFFRFRHERLKNDFRRLAALPLVPKKVLITGASGLVGRSLSRFLSTAGHEVFALVRSTPVGARQIGWNPGNGFIEREKLEGFDAVIHLAGESIASGRWNQRRKADIRQSRVDGTLFLAGVLARLQRPPKAFLGASAVGFYGDRGNEVLTETSPQGSGFLPDVCFEWERVSDTLRQAGVRVAHLRTGIVLSLGGGALAQMAPPFSFGLGGVVGSGGQWMSWIGLEDLVGAYYFLLSREDLSGVFNATAPGAVTNRDFTQSLGKVLRRPTAFPLPAAAVKLLFGEMGQRLLLEGQHVAPSRLQAAGFEFLYPTLEPALGFELGKWL